MSGNSHLSPVVSVYARCSSSTPLCVVYLNVPRTAATCEEAAPQPPCVLASAPAAPVACRLRCSHGTHHACTLHTQKNIVPGQKPPSALMRRPQFQVHGRVSSTRASCCAGVNVGLTFSLRYASPELAAAQERGATTTCSHASADIWALGVVAWELAARRRAFPSAASAADIRAALAGKAPARGGGQRLRLPWEERGGGDALGMLRPVVMACLSRDAAARPTADELSATLSELLEYSAEDTVARGLGSQ